MKASGTGRILVWQGGSLWIGLSGEPTDVHSHHAVQITLPFTTNEVRFRRPGSEWRSYTAAIIAANKPHAYEARGEYVAMIFVEPESRYGQALQQRYREEGIASLPKEAIENRFSHLVAQYRQTASDQDLIRGAQAIIEQLAFITPPPEISLDRRIERSLEFIRSRVDERIMLSEVADAVHLSADRFRHLFIEQTGLRFRPYVLWLRIELALTQFAANRSLTEAAHAGGFADSAHFSRTFKRMFGISPSSYQRE